MWNIRLPVTPSLRSLHPPPHAASVRELEQDILNSIATLPIAETFQFGPRSNPELRRIFNDFTKCIGIARHLEQNEETDMTYSIGLESGILVVISCFALVPFCSWFVEAVFPRAENGQVGRRIKTLVPKRTFRIQKKNYDATTPFMVGMCGTSNHGIKMGEFPLQQFFLENDDHIAQVFREADLHDNIRNDLSINPCLCINCGGNEPVVTRHVTTGYKDGQICNVKGPILRCPAKIVLTYQRIDSNNCSSYFIAEE